LPIEDSIAKKSGVLDYDLVTSVNSQNIEKYEDLKKIIEENAGKNLNINLKRAINCDVTKSKDCNFQDLTLQITPSDD
jgi:C-terminal processing protease CtpA/Prc